MRSSSRFNTPGTTVYLQGYGYNIPYKDKAKKNYICLGEHALPVTRPLSQCIFSIENTSNIFSVVMPRLFYLVKEGLHTLNDVKTFPPFRDCILCLLNKPFFFAIKCSVML